MLFLRAFEKALTLLFLLCFCMLLLLPPKTSNKLVFAYCFVLSALCFAVQMDSNCNSKSNSKLLQFFLGKAEEEEEVEQEILAVILSAIPLLVDKKEGFSFQCCVDWFTRVSQLNSEVPNAVFKL